MDIQAAVILHGHKIIRSFGKEKIVGNIARDQKNYVLLRALGWHVFVVWECELKHAVVEETLDSLISNIQQCVSDI